MREWIERLYDRLEERWSNPDEPVYTQEEFDKATEEAYEEGFEMGYDEAHKDMLSVYPEEAA